MGSCGGAGIAIGLDCCPWAGTYAWECDTGGDGGGTDDGDGDC